MTWWDRNLIHVSMGYISAVPISPFAVRGWPRPNVPVAALMPVKDGISGKPKTPRPEQGTRSQNLQGFTAKNTHREQGIVQHEAHS
jgi:hypothetical protein